MRGNLEKRIDRFVQHYKEQVAELEQAVRRLQHGVAARMSEEERRLLDALTEELTSGRWKRRRKLTKAEADALIKAQRTAMELWASVGYGIAISPGLCVFALKPPDERGRMGLPAAYVGFHGGSVDPVREPGRGRMHQQKRVKPR